MKTPTSGLLFCYRCGQAVEADLVRLRMRNGTSLCFVRGSCGHRLRDVTYYQLHQRGLSPEDLELVEDYLENTRCSVRDCLNTDIELHHFLPKGIAKTIAADPDAWPTVYLCRYHHAMWHKLMKNAKDERDVETLLEDKAVRG